MQNPFYFITKYRTPYEVTKLRLFITKYGTPYVLKLYAYSLRNMEPLMPLLLNIEPLMCQTSIPIHYKTWNPFYPFY